MTRLAQALDHILGRTAVDEAMLGRTVGMLAVAGADLADLYLEATTTVRWNLENGRVIGGGFAVDQGMGARVARGAEVAFAYGADLAPASLRDTAGAAAAMLGHGDAARYANGLSVRRTPERPALYPASDPTTVDAADWIALLERVDVIARAQDPRVVRVDAQLMTVGRAMLVIDIDGHLSGDTRPLSRLSVSIMAESGGRRARGQAALGGRYGREGLDDAGVADAVRRAVRMACVNLDARPGPTGMMPVVLAAGYPGVLFHEAVGHGLEADHHRKSLSAFAGRMGERVAAPGVTVIDDGGIAGRPGSLTVDDEGTPADRTVLIDDGMLVGLMYDRLNAGLMNARSTGNGRRQSYAHLPMPRMTNTFLAPGDADPADILASVKNGIYAVEFGGGQVDITTGRFNFTTTEAYLIENGRVTAPIDAATLIGVGDEALRHIDMVGIDGALDSGAANCGKAGQWLDVGVGQPTIRVARMQVGGRG